MSELLDAFRREAWRFQELQRRVHELRGEMERARSLEKEISQMLNERKKEEVERLFEFLRNAMLRDLRTPLHVTRAAIGVVVGHLMHLLNRREDVLTVLRELARSGEELRRLIDFAERLGIPDPPGPPSARPDLEVELPLLDRIRPVRVREIYFEDGRIRLRYEKGAELSEREIKTALDLPLLTPIYQHVEGLLQRAIEEYRKYQLELEGLRARIQNRNSVGQDR
jgi:signal transduction histidine kinase